MTAVDQQRPTATTESTEFGGATIYRAALFSPSQASLIVDVVDSVLPRAGREAWTSPGSSMATIGEPFYRNRDRQDHYTRCARSENSDLYRHFRVAHEAVAVFFEQRYGAPVVFAEELAVPGFHIFSYLRAGDYAGGSWHFDSLHQQVPFFANHHDEVEAVVNFTLPVQVPNGGTGMDVCEDEPGAPSPGAGATISTPYVPGVLVFTERDYWHRIGGSTCLTDGERRVTCQGHGVRFRGRWILFW